MQRTGAGRRMMITRSCVASGITARRAKPFSGSHEKLLKQNPPTLQGKQRPKEGQMRRLMFGACLLAVAIVGFHNLISSALVAARDTKAATFSERFAPALKTPSG